MRLEDFKRVADEALAELTVDERMVSRIHQGMCGVTVKKRQRTRRAPLLLAAGFAAVMLLSGGMLLRGTGLLSGPQAQPLHAGTLSRPEFNAVSRLSGAVQTSVFSDGTVLPYAVASVGEYSEGFAPARATNGLYGYVDESGVWVVHARYESAGAVADGHAEVTLEGASESIAVPEA